MDIYIYIHAFFIIYIDCLNFIWIERFKYAIIYLYIKNLKKILLIKKIEKNNGVNINYESFKNNY